MVPPNRAYRKRWIWPHITRSTYLRIFRRGARIHQIAADDHQIRLRRKCVQGFDGLLEHGIVIDQPLIQFSLRAQVRGVPMAC